MHEQFQVLIDSIEDYRESIELFHEEKCLLLNKFAKLLETENETENFEEFRREWPLLQVELEEIDNKAKASFQLIKADVAKLQIL